MFVCFCIRQHDVNILMQSFLEKRRDVCVLRFFLLFFFNMLSYRSWNKTAQLIKVIFITLMLLCVFCIFVRYNGIKQHDVNILMHRILRRVNNVCVLRFSSLRLWKVIVQGVPKIKTKANLFLPFVFLIMFFFWIVFFCIRQHDVNILTQSF